MSILILQSSWWGRESWLLWLICLPGVLWWLSVSSARCHGVVCGLWLWYFLIILTYYFWWNNVTTSSFYHELWFSFNHFQQGWECSYTWSYCNGTARLGKRARQGFRRCYNGLWLWVHLGHTGQCKRTGGCYNELVVAFFSTGGCVKGKKIYTCWLYYLFINLHLFYLWWHLAHRPPVTLQFMALQSNSWFNSWFGLQIQQSSGVLPWKVLFSIVTA